MKAADPFGVRRFAPLWTAVADRRIQSGAGRRTPKTHSQGQQGFTLLEMIVVLVIIAMMAGLLGTSIVGRMDSVKVATSARDLASALRFTRSQAILLHKEQFLEVDLEKRSYVAPGRDAVALPESLQLKLLTASSEATSDKQGRIRFFPDGGSTGGRVTLIAGEREWKVNVSWLTGEIELDDGRKDART